MLNPKIKRRVDFFTANIHHFSRVVICLYYFNFAFSNLSNYFSQDNLPLPFEPIIVMMGSIMVMLNRGMKYAGLIMMLFAIYHSGETILHQLQYWWLGYGFYFNELMVKRIAVVGCFGLIYGRHLLSLTGDESAGISGLLLEDKRDTMATKYSGVLLVFRVSISAFFMFVGISEINRQLASHTPDAMGRMPNQRPPGDGHDEIWAKLLQFSLSLPMLVGLKNEIVAPLTALVCFAEAFWCWQFWSATAAGLGHGYQVHAREHFAVNIAVAGGLLLLSNYGAGKYSVDAYLKKRD